MLSVKRVISQGEMHIEPGYTKDDVLNAAARLLDKAYATAILGTVLFEGSDGKFYGVWTEAFLDEANPEYVEDVMEEVECRS